MIVTAYIEHFGEAGYMSWIEGDKFKGLVVQGKNIDEVKLRLYRSLRIKIAYDYELDVENVMAREVSIEDLPIVKETETDKQYQLELMR